MTDREVVKNEKEIIEEVAEDICMNYCRYRDTPDEDGLCDRIRDGSACPLDRLWGKDRAERE